MLEFLLGPARNVAEDFRSEVEGTERSARTPLRLIDAAFLYAPPGAPPQQWHMDSWTEFIVVDTLVLGMGHTDFLDVPFRRIGEKDTPDTLRGAYPANWDSQSPVAPRPELATVGSSTAFFSTCIHRAPQSPPEMRTARCVLYAAYVPNVPHTQDPDTEQAVFEEQWAAYVAPGDRD